MMTQMLKLGHRHSSLFECTYFIANYKPMPPYVRVHSKSLADVLFHSLIF